jgi:hypothetical protein
MLTNVHRSSCTVLVVMVRSKLNLNFLDRGLKSTQILNFMNIRSVGAEMFHANRTTDMTKIIVAFRNFANAPNNVHIYSSPLQLLS